MKAIDWPLCIKLAAGNIDLARELLQKFIEDLPNEFDALEKAFEAKDTEGLLSLVHRLHGACCYCGTPLLKQAALDLEVALKQQALDDIQPLYQELKQAIQTVLTEFKRNSF